LLEGVGIHGITVTARNLGKPSSETSTFKNALGW